MLLGHEGHAGAPTHPGRVDFKDWIIDRPGDMPVRTTRAMPGRCPRPTPTCDAPLEQPLAPLDGD
eukprot:9458386-Pyramimonas_sp.AAC.1